MIRGTTFSINGKLHCFKITVVRYPTRLLVFIDTTSFLSIACYIVSGSAFKNIFSLRVGLIKIQNLLSRANKQQEYSW